MGKKKKRESGNWATEMRRGERENNLELTVYKIQ